MFKNLFGKKEEEELEDDYYAAIDPVLQQRRKEKFSTPFLDDDDDEEVVEVKKEPVKEVKSEPKKEEVKKPVYVRSQVISPILGVRESKVTPTVTIEPKPVKKTKQTSVLIPKISPISGPAGYEVEEESQPSKIKKARGRKKKPVKEESVEENIRNIAKLSEEGKEDLRIIEERTGEFKLDFNDSKDTFIDSIDDDMSLDELMSLYEKKFKD